MRTIKFIQVNIFKGKYFNSLVEFIKKEDPDIISAQEVTTYQANLFKDKTVDLFKVLKEKVNMNGVYAGIIKFNNLKNGILGNAVFYKFPIVGKKIIILKTFRPVAENEVDGPKALIIRPQLARNLIDATLKIGDRKIHALCWHGAWTAPPTDTQETLRQAKIASDYLKNLRTPFILGGDLNNTIESKTVGLINKVANNLMFKASVKMTTHPKIHKIAPRGFLIDYIFVSKHFKLKSIRIPEILVSDHLPVVAEVKLAD